MQEITRKMTFYKNVCVCVCARMEFPPLDFKSTKSQPVGVDLQTALITWRDHW